MTLPGKVLKTRSTGMCAMRFWRRQSIIWTVFSTFLGIFAFYVLLAVLNAFVPPGNGILRGLVTLLADNFPYFIVIALILMTGEIFDRFSFPLNLPAPLFHALASVFLVLLIFNVFEFLDAITRANIYRNLEILRILLSILIFLIVFTGGSLKSSVTSSGSGGSGSSRANPRVLPRTSRPGTISGTSSGSSSSMSSRG